jgi:hypothetical protein
MEIWDLWVEEVVPPDLFDPIDHIPEFIEQGHLIEIVIE